MRKRLIRALGSAAELARRDATEDVATCDFQPHVDDLGDITVELDSAIIVPMVEEAAGVDMSEDHAAAAAVFNAYHDAYHARALGLLLREERARGGSRG